ncbi:MAG: methionyl-tRNA formyltransferase [Clostridia bacterium]|nr:methionyl-tRNA formyltransferase [Clostridia bacterium]
MYSVIYMGTPDFAVPCLKALSEAGADIRLVVTQPDKPVGRKQILTPSDVKITATELGLEVYQPNTLKSDEAYDYLRSFSPDFIVVAAYGKILPKRVLEIPRIAPVNVHGSLLPHLRGAAPIQRAVIGGDKVSGITTMLMGEGLDTGDILLQRETPIGENETAGELFDRLAAMSPALLLETLDGLMNGTITPVRQNDDEADYAAMLSQEEACICADADCETVFNLIRGMNPWPVAYTYLDGKKFKLRSCEKTNLPSNGRRGLLALDGKLYYACADRLLRLEQIQAEGGKCMTGEAYLRGHKI